MPYFVLTKQEYNTVTLAGIGYSDKRIASELFLVPKTVGKALSSAYKKLGVTERKELPKRLTEVRIRPKLTIAELENFEEQQRMLLT